MNKFKVVAEYIWTVVLIVALLVFIIGVAFAIPIWFRPFYYMQIGPLNIVEESGFSYEQILAAYNDVMNYLNFGTPFGVGGLKCSESAASHFADCKILFDLDTWGVIISAVLLLGGFLLAKFAGVKPKKLGGFEFSFYSGLVGAIIPPVVGIAIAVDFEKAFTLFHSLFFPGKDNWRFNWYTDEIIRILPEEFFMNCGILIIALWFAACIALIVRGVICRRKTKMAVNACAACGKKNGTECLTCEAGKGAERKYETTEDNKYDKTGSR